MRYWNGFLLMSDENTKCFSFKTEAVVEWLTEQGVWGSNLGLATWILEIGYLLLASRDMAKRSSKNKQPTVSNVLCKIVFLLCQFARHSVLAFTDNTAISPPHPKTDSCFLSPKLSWFRPKSTKLVHGTENALSHVSHVLTPGCNGN